MKTNQWQLIVAVAMLIGCGGVQAVDLSRPLLKEPWDYEKIVVEDADVTLKTSQNVSVSAFGYNPRNFEQANLQAFNVPISWLKDAQALDDQIYIVKQVGSSLLFCLIEPEEFKSREQRSYRAVYNLFVVKTDESFSEDDFDWTVYLKKMYGTKYFSHRSVDIGEHRAMQLNWDVDYYWNAPTVFVRHGDKVFQLILIYSGTSRTYVNQIMTKFP